MAYINISSASVEEIFTLTAAVVSGSKQKYTGGQNGTGKITHVMGDASQYVHFWYTNYDVDGFTNSFKTWAAVDPAKRDKYGIHYYIRGWHWLKVRYTTDVGTYVEVPIELETAGHTGDGDSYAEGTIPATYSPIPVPAKWENIP